MKLSIAFLQLLPAGSLKENIEKGIKACLHAKEKVADIALFPEMWSCGYTFPHEDTSLRECSIASDSCFVKQFSELSAELDMAASIMKGSDRLCRGTHFRSRLFFRNFPIDKCNRLHYNNLCKRLH